MAATYLYKTPGSTLSPLGDEDRWDQGPQPLIHPVGNQLTNLAYFGLGVGALGLLGRTQITPTTRGWDYYLKGIRGAEEYFPARILRTFQLSHMLSALETPSLQSRFISPEIIRELSKDKIGKVWLEHLSRLTGEPVDVGRMAQHGIRFEAGKLYLGQTSEVLLEHAAIHRVTPGAIPSFQTTYGRSLAGGPLFGKPPSWAPREGVEFARYETRQANRLFTQKTPYLSPTGERLEEAFTITGGRTRREAVKRFAYGYGTSLVERLNQLARAPFEMEPMASVFTKVPILKDIRLGVVPSSGLKTLGKLTAKLGILGTAAYISYQELDYATRKSSLFDNTLFAEGITAGVATAWTKGQVAASKLADVFGLHAYRERQEEIAPGSTNLSTLAAFPIAGMMTGLTGGYLRRVIQQATYQQKLGLSIEKASLATSLEAPVFKELLYGEKVPEEMVGLAGQDIVDLVRKQTSMKLGTWQGSIARRIATVQGEKTFLGRAAGLLGKMTPTKISALLPAALGFAAILPFLPGALIPSKRPEELERIYSGQQEVPIRKGRFWEMGRSPWEGENISRFRPHWYPRMLARGREKSIYGEEDPSPITQWYRENFTYETEKEHYFDRPYPVTGSAFADVPFIGPVLGATIGKLVKPPRLMHVDEWTREGTGGTEYLNMPLEYGDRAPIPELGEAGPGTPISPYGLKGVVGEQLYRTQQMVGLPGFTASTIKEAITGEQNVFGQEMQLESAQKIYGQGRTYWDMEVGGGFFSTELLRRLYPHPRNQIPLYNPIPNQMPQWLPGPGERSPDFRHGDPFASIPEGEIRLPGPGYAARYPELQGVAPADYPLVHRLKILSDVAMYSDQYKQTVVQARAAAKRGELSEQEMAMYEETLRQVQEKKIRKEFTPYQYKERARTPIEEVLARANEEEKNKPGPGWFERTVGRGWEVLTHGLEGSSQFITPISPISKLVHQRTAVEDYLKMQVYGTQSAFWGHPYRDFIRPATSVFAHSMGWEGIPTPVQEKRDIEEYFDILKYVKATKLQTTAQEQGDIEAVKEYGKQRRETLFGIDPFTKNLSQIYRALPRRERDYYESFIGADLEERQTLLKALPENEQSLFIAKWKQKDAADLQEAIKRNLLSEKQVIAAEAEIQGLYEESESEGLPKNKQLWQEYLSTRNQGETYTDWYRRTKLLPEKLQGRPLPGPDWVGFFPQVDLEDIKLKVVENEGKSMYDFDLWPDRQRAVAGRPLVEEAARELGEAAPLSIEEIRGRVNQVLAANNIKHATVLVSPMPGQEHQIDLRLKEDRGDEAKEMIRRRGLN